MNISFPWMVEAAKHVGLKEIPGKENNPTIINWLKSLRAWWSEDETPWCGTFAAHCMQVAGIPLPKHWYRAKDWANWGSRLVTPIYGCVVVFERKGGGHVGFVLGVDSKGRLLVIGGNQGNQVSVMPFDRARVVGFFWPPGVVFEPVSLPVLHSAADSSTNEA